MTSEQLKATIRQRPFRPFTIRMVDGRSCTVTNPDVVMVSSDDSSIVVDLMLMNELEVPSPRGAG